MSGITSGVGVFSGVNRDQIIGQLLAIDARPKSFAQNRIKSLQGLQAAYLDINTKVAGLRTNAQAFNVNSIFRAATATSSNADALTATASNGAAPGVYSFIVDRLVSTQQSLSNGFTNSTSDGIGLTNITVESTLARLDRDTSLSQLNGGAGIERGRIQITDSSGTQTTLDLSRVGTVNDVLEAFNSNTTVKVSARVEGDRLIISDRASGLGTLTIANATGSNTAASLGIVGTGVAGTLTGQRINTVGGFTALSSLNGGLGVSINTAASLAATPDFRITTRAGNAFDIDIGDTYTSGTGGALVKVKSAATDLATVVQRINEQTGGDITASIDSATNSLKLVDNTVPDSGGSLTVTELNSGTTATDLGILGTTATDTLSGRRLVAGLNSTLARNLRGGQGVAGNGNLSVTVADGTAINFTLTNSQSVADIISGFNTAAAGKATLSLNQNGTGFTLNDTTTGTSANISGDGATTLGFTTGAFSTSSLKSGRSQLRYVGESSRLETLNGGAGVGIGQFEVINSYGERYRVNIDATVQTVGDLAKRISSQAQNITAKVNDNGDGLVITENAKPSGAGGQKISIRDLSGGVARSLNLVGTAAGVGAQNVVNGSFERSIAISATDTLDQINTKINDAGVLVTSSILNDGSGARPFRLSLTARSSGLAGAFVIDTTGTDLGFQTVAEARNARVFYGSNDAARGVLLSSTTNTISGAINRVSVDLKAASANPVTVTISRDNATLEKSITDFVDSFNTLVGSIDSRSNYDQESNKRGVLLGDTAAQSLRAELFSTIAGGAQGVSGRFSTLSQVGITVKSGKLSFDAEKLRSAMQLDANAVQQLLAAKTADAATTTPTQTPILGTDGQPIPGAFTNSSNSTNNSRFTTLGVVERVAALADRYIRAVDGVLTRSTKTLDDQIKFQNTRITSIDASIERRRDILNRQFLAMESAIGKLQGQSGALNSIRSIS